MNWIEHRYPEIIADGQKLKENLILDGEIIVLSKKGLPDFNLLQSREQTENTFKISLLAKQYPAIYYVFDILAKGNSDLTNLKLSERKYILNKTIPNNMVHIRKVFYLKGQGTLLWRYVKKFNIEGVMAKDSNSKYLIGVRSKSWLKIKNIKTADCIICGYTIGIKKFASLVLGQYYKGKIIHVGQVGTGFNSKQIEELSKMLEKSKTTKSPFSLQPKLARKVVWVKPKLVAEIEFLDYTKKLHLRAPSFKRLRFDKPLKDCIIEK